MITITEKAKEYKQSVYNGGYVALAVKGGGCSGFQYEWGFAKNDEILRCFRFKDETLQLDLRKKQSRIFKNHFQGDTRNR